MKINLNCIFMLSVAICKFCRLQLPFKSNRIHMADDKMEIGNDSESNELINEPESSVPWSELPSIVLENIYFYLNRRDQCRMSLVCRNWAKAHNSPRIWRTMKFHLPHYGQNRELYPEVLLARKYGHMIRHVYIICLASNDRLREIIGNQMQLFLQALTTHSELLTISFVNPFRYFHFHEDNMYSGIHRTIINLLNSQNKLQSIEFRKTVFKISEATEVLNTICTKNSQKLKKLVLHDFALYIRPRDDIVIPSIFHSLVNLEELNMNYSLLFESILTTSFGGIDKFLKLRKGKGTLKKLELHCDDFKRDNYLGIQPQVWKNLREIHPNLKINLFVQRKTNRRFEVFIARYMPVASLDFRQDIFCFEMDIGKLLRHLQWCKINECIEKLSILQLQCIPNLAVDLINFLKGCPKLKELRLHIKNPVETLESLFTFWLENGILSLKNVHITIVNAPPRNAVVRNYSDIANDYAPLLLSNGLNLILLTDYGY